MASELRVNTLKDASGNNSIATSFVANGSAKAWVSYKGTDTNAVKDSLNISSVVLLAKCVLTCAKDAEASPALSLIHI